MSHALAHPFTAQSAMVPVIERSRLKMDLATATLFQCRVDEQTCLAATDYETREYHLHTNQSQSAITNC